MQENWFVCFYFGSFGRLVGSLMSGIVCNVVVVYKRGQQRTFIMLTIIELGKSTTNKNVEYNKVFFLALSQF